MTADVTTTGGKAAATVKVRRTSAAAAKLVLPAWLTVTLQEPAATSVSTVPLTVQTDGVVDANVTARPDVEVALRAGAAVEIEGFVTDIPTASRFMLGNIVVDASAISPLNAQIKKGTRVEVHGTWQSGVLRAAKVKIEDQQALEQVEIEARIEQFTSRADFVVRGQRCDATGATISPSTDAALKVDVKVKLKGSKAGDVLLVTELEIDD